MPVRSLRAGDARTLALVQSLPETARRVVTLRFVYGLAQADVAARLGVSESEVSRSLAEAARAVATNTAGKGSRG